MKNSALLLLLGLVLGCGAHTASASPRRGVSGAVAAVAEIANAFDFSKAEVKAAEQMTSRTPEQASGQGAVRPRRYLRGFFRR